MLIAPPFQCSRSIIQSIINNYQKTLLGAVSALLARQRPDLGGREIKQIGHCTASGRKARYADGFYRVPLARAEYKVDRNVCCLLERDFRLLMNEGEVSIWTERWSKVTTR